ncbi:MAG: DUF3179 domain-containing protein [Saprospiraceae bacterium]|nr:DUF3179 domain-containing protein [Saprospiraceae bacterium]
MQKGHMLTISCVALALILGCDKTETIGPRPVGSTSTDQGWLVPKNLVIDGGPGKDGIPSVDKPTFVVASEVDYLPAEDLVIVIKMKGQVRAYPHDILDWHEIVNDRLGGVPFAITYCPLTGTGVAWDRLVQGIETTFGVSGLLYNSNLMPYDRYTESTWSQQRLDCVNGTLLGAPIPTYEIVETSFSSFRTTYPEGEVMSTDTGFDRPYGDYPYGRYLQHDELLFPVTRRDDRLPLKERTLGVLIGKEGRRVYQFSQTSSNIEMSRDTLNGQALILVRSNEHNLLVAFGDDGRSLALADDPFPAILEDEEGQTYDFMGLPLDDSSDASSLYLPNQFIGYWFSWGTFYSGIEISSW